MGELVHDGSQRAKLSRTDVSQTHGKWPGQRTRAMESREGKAEHATNKSDLY